MKTTNWLQIVVKFLNVVFVVPNLCTLGASYIRRAGILCWWWSRKHRASNYIYCDAEILPLKTSSYVQSLSSLLQASPVAAAAATEAVVILKILSHFYCRTLVVYWSTVNVMDHFFSLRKNQQRNTIIYISQHFLCVRAHARSTHFKLYCSSKYFYRRQFIYKRQPAKYHPLEFPNIRIIDV